MKEIGQQIQKARLERGISLEEIADRTRIQIAHLQKIETGRFDFLPRPYVVAFVKAFAQHVGLNGEALIKRWRELEQAEALQRHEQQRPQMPPVQEVERRPPVVPITTRAAQSPASRQFPYLKEFLIAFGMVLGMAILVYWMLKSDGSDTTKNQDRAVQPAQGRHQSKVPEIPFSEVSKETAAKFQAAVPPGAQTLTLQAQFDGQAWMRVISDGTDTSDFVYHTGNVQTWQAQERFKITVGNAGAVTLILDGKNLGEIAQSGRTATLTITRDGIVEKRVSRPRPRTAAPRDTSGARLLND